MSCPPTLKSYSVIRLVLPSRLKADGTIASTRTTYLYVKEHHSFNSSDAEEQQPSKKRKNASAAKKQQNKSLFIANLPADIYISTPKNKDAAKTVVAVESCIKLVFDKILRDVMPEGENVECVTCDITKSNSATGDNRWLPNSDVLKLVSLAEEIPTPTAPGATTATSNKKTNFGYLTFRTPAQLKALVKILASNAKKNNEAVTVTIDEEDLGVCGAMAGGSSCDDAEKLEDKIGKSVRQLTKDPTLQRLLYQHTNHPSEKQLQSDCDDTMSAYEIKEKQRNALNTSSRKMNLGLPDEDGFVTVTYKNSNSEDTKREWITAGGDNGGGGGDQNKRRKSNKRSRSGSKKKAKGTAPQTNFYKFQIKDGKRQSLTDLREKFERDKLKVKELMEKRGSGFKQFK